jgi:peroxiredoxin
VVIEDTLPAAIEVAEEQQLTFPSVLDVAGDVKAAYGVTGTPETFLVDADGVVVAKWIGPLPDARRRVPARARDWLIGVASLLESWWPRTR